MNPESAQPLRVITAELSDQIQSALVKDLAEIFPEPESSTVQLFSAEPPAWIRLVGDLLTWTLPLKVAATAYLTQLAKHLADETWENRARIRKAASDAAGRAMTPLLSVVRALFRATRDVSRQLRVFLVLSIPDDYWGTSVYVPVADELEVLEHLALFVANVEAIHTAVAQLLSDGHQPLGGFRVEFQEGQFVITWKEQANFKSHSRRYDAISVSAKG